MRVAFLILAHAEPEVLRRLTVRLSRVGDVYVHVDAKSNIEEFVGIENSNVHFCSVRVNVAWAGISMVDAINVLFRTAMKKNYDYYVTLTGACYPTQDLDFFIQYLKSSNGKNLLKYIDMRESPKVYMRQLLYKHFKEPTMVAKWSVKVDRYLRWGLRKLKLKNKYCVSEVPYYGSTWFALTHETLEYVMRYQSDNPDYYRKNIQTFAPDEHYFHTIVGNSPYGNKPEDYQGRGLWRLANFHIIDKSLSRWYTQCDMQEIKDYKDRYFVRKIRFLDGAELMSSLDGLENKVENISSC